MKKIIAFFKKLFGSKEEVLITSKPKSNKWDTQRNERKPRPKRKPKPKVSEDIKDPNLYQEPKKKRKPRNKRKPKPNNGGDLGVTGSGR